LEAKCDFKPAVWPPGSADTVCPRPPLTMTFDLETGMQVTSKVVGNLPSKFGHARPLGSRIIHYVCDGRTDGRTKATLIAPFPKVGGIKIAELLLTALT